MRPRVIPSNIEWIPIAIISEIGEISTLQNLNLFYSYFFSLISNILSKDSSI